MKFVRSDRAFLDNGGTCELKPCCFIQFSRGDPNEDDAEIQMRLLNDAAFPENLGHGAIQYVRASVEEACL